MVRLSRELSSVGAESDAQMRMFDMLGPKAREALNYWPREPNVRTFMRSFKMEWTREQISRCRGDDIDVPDVPFDEPAFDAAFADYIDRKFFDLTKTRIPCLQPSRKRRPYFLRAASR